MLLGASWLGLRSLASGIPVAVLANPRLALAQSCEPAKRKYLLLCTSKDGDPINCNVPGTYADPNVVHPLDPRMAKTDLMLGSVATSAAKPWSTLPQAVLNRTVFFHHSTRTNSHANQAKVMRLMGAKEMLPSFIANQMAGCLGTVQSEPFSLGATDPGETLTYENRPQPNLSPRTLKDLLAVPNGPLAQLQALRDSDLNRMNTLFRTSGTSAQRQFLDRWATSQAQARSLTTSLLQGLSQITDDGPKGQALAAATMFKLNVTPVLTMKIGFGGDNHADSNLGAETTGHLSGIASIAEVMAQLAAVGLSDQVTFAILNVFGRELAPADHNGRTHLADHHCAVLIGAAFRPGIVGGIAPTATDYGATGIDAATGAAMPTGGIVRDETLASLGKTVSKAMGIADAPINLAITGGQSIGSALV